jgi:hypothetical protein
VKLMLLLTSSFGWLAVNDIARLRSDKVCGRSA